MKTEITLTYLFTIWVLTMQGAMAEGLATIRGGVSSNNYTLVNSDGSSWVSTTQKTINIGLTLPIDETAYIDFFLPRVMVLMTWQHTPDR